MLLKKIEKNIYPGIAFFLLIYLYLLSPFNQKLINPDMPGNEFWFISIKFYFSLVWVLFFLSFYKLLKSKLNDLFYAFLIWNIMFFLLSLTFTFGFDITDEGWQLAKSWGILHGNFTDNADLIWGSSLINGLWYEIINTPKLIWSRFGYLLFLPFFGVIIFLILVNFFSKKLSFISTVISFLLFYRNFLNYNVVNYYYLPVFALLLSCFFLVKYQKNQNSSYKYLILSAFLAGISIHIKFTFILIIPFFMVYIFLFKDEIGNKKKFITIYYTSLFSSLLIGFLILLFFGGISDFTVDDHRLSILNMFKAFFGQSQVNSSLSYSYGHLISIYYKDFYEIIYGSIVPIIILFLGAFSIKNNNNLKYLIVILISVFMLFSYRENIQSHLYLFQLMFAIIILIIVFNRKINKDFFHISFVFYTIFLASFLGSGLSFFTGLISLGFFGAAALTLCLVYESESKLIHFKTIFYSIIIFAVINQFSKSYTPYRDLPSQYLNTMFKSPELVGIYSFKERVETVDEFMIFAKSHDIKKDKAIFVAMPIFYYLLDVKPVISETHDVILGFDQLKKEVNEAKPNVIVVPAQSPRGQFWPLEQNKDFWTKDGFERQTAHYYKFYKEYISENNFEKIFENAMFIVYRKAVALEEEIQP